MSGIRMDYVSVLTANDAPPGSAWRFDLWRPSKTEVFREMRKEFKL